MQNHRKTQNTAAPTPGTHAPPLFIHHDTETDHEEASKDDKQLGDEMLPFVVFQSLPFLQVQQTLHQVSSTLQLQTLTTR